MIITRTKAQRGGERDEQDANDTASANQMHYFGAQMRKDDGNPFEERVKKEKFAGDPDAGAIWGLLMGL